VEKGEHKINQLKDRIQELENEVREVKSEYLTSSDEELREIFESLQDIYFRCDLNGQITMLNPAVQELTGYVPSDIIHKNITNYYLYNPKVKNLIRRLIKDRQVRNFEASVVKNNGDILQCLCNIRLIRNKGGHVIEGVVRDITELKKVNAELLYAKEIAERSLKVKEKFLANMSHEIRTPLNGIIGMIDLVAKTKLNLEQSEYIETIKRSSEILLSILNDILEISKIEAGKVELRKKAVDFVKVIDKVKDLFQQEALRNGISFMVNHDPTIPLYLVLDETRFLQILSNLISNAIKFTDHGGSVEINISCEELESSACKILIEVKDSGIGISEELQGSLFQSFNQLDNSLNKQYSGTGLGLAISQELCRLMGSEIKLDSLPGKGSKFWFYIIADIENQLPNTTNSERREKELFFKESPSILLVDDNKINRDVARHILLKANCTVKEAESGKKAIEYTKTEKFDLIIMDIQMPDMDGIEAMKLIRGLEQKDTPPIIAMTAYAMEEDEIRFLAQGFDGYIAKPIRADLLVQSAAKWMGSSGGNKDSSVFNTAVAKSVVLNMDTVESLRSYGGEALIKETYQEFEVEAIELLTGINKALTKTDYSIILSNLHTLKGNAGTLGIERLYKFSAQIESNIKRKEYSNLEKDLKLLNAAFAEFREKYKSILKFS